MGRVLSVKVPVDMTGKIFPFITTYRGWLIAKIGKNRIAIFNINHGVNDDG